MPPIKITLVVGTRPEIIKMSPVIKECQARNLSFFLIHSNQHYTPALDAIIFEDLDIPHPRHNLRVGSGTHGTQTGKILMRIEKILMREKPDIVLVQGDTNTVLAGALAAKKLHIKIGHIEAGLRSYSAEMPEEINRVLADHCSDLMFAPTAKAKMALVREGLSPKKIILTGNTIVDAIRQNLPMAESRSKILHKFKLDRQKYFLSTFHRPENVDNKPKLKNILSALGEISKIFSWPIVCPIHPRTLKKIKEFSQAFPAGIQVVPPMGYLDFLMLESNAKLVLTDSGGIQEETCILNIPCVTLRDNTERPETILAGSNMLAGTNSEAIRRCVDTMLQRNTNWQNPFGSGKAAAVIIDAILSKS